MLLDEFYDYKNQLMEDILTTREIVDLICGDKEQTLPARNLAYKQVFPFEYIPETVEHGQTFVCFDVDIQKSANQTFYYPIIYVWIFSHKSLLRLPEGGVRVDRLAAEIAKKLSGSFMYGLGALDLYSSKRFAPITDYQGKVLVFHAVDFNAPKPTRQPIPSNRKKG